MPLAVSGRSITGCRACPTGENVKFLCGRLGWRIWLHCSHSACHRHSYGQGMGRTLTLPHKRSRKSVISWNSTGEIGRFRRHRAETHRHFNIRFFGQMPPDASDFPGGIPACVSQVPMATNGGAHKFNKTIIIGSISTLNLNR